MKKFLFLIFLFPVLLYSQTVDTIKGGFVGNVTISGLTSLGGDEWDVVVNSSSFLGGFDPTTGSNYLFTEIAVGYNFFVNCTLFRIDSISDPVPGLQKVLRIRKPSGIGNAPINGLKAGVLRRTSLNNLSRVPLGAVNAGEQGLSREDVNCLINDLIERLDNLSQSISGGIDTFNLDSPVLREVTTGAVIGGNSFSDWAAYHYFTPPTISLAQSPTTTVYEVGDSVRITYTATVTNAGAATLSNGSIYVSSPSAELDDFGSATTGSAIIEFTPLETPVDTFDSYIYQIQASQAWSKGAESGTATSNTRTIRATYPVFYGMASADTTSVLSDIYNNLIKESPVALESTKTLSFTGTGLIYFAIPASWSDTVLSSILAVSSGNVEAKASFTRSTNFTVTSDDLTNNYTNVPYVVYYLNTGETTTSGEIYSFIR